MRFTVGEINVICTSLQRSLAFYRDVLGFEPVRQEGAGWHMRNGNVRFLLLGVAANPQPVIRYCQQPEFSVDLLVDDLQDALRHFRKHKVQPMDDFDPDQDRFFVRDPDGLVFEIIQASGRDGA